MNNKWLKCVLFLLARPLSTSSKAFVNGARMCGVCAFIAGYFEYEVKLPRFTQNVVNTSASNTDFSHLELYICGILCIEINRTHND